LWWYSVALQYSSVTSVVKKAGGWPPEYPPDAIALGFMLFHWRTK
jgi:hypothetical protein